MEQREHSQQATAEYFNAEAGGWSDHYSGNRHFRTRLETVLGWLSDKPAGLKLLDYGCGSGVLTRALVEAGHEVIGVDISPGMLEAARKNLAGTSGSYKFEQAGPGFEGGWQTERYDGIISLGVIEYLDEPYKLLQILASRLNHSSFLILSYPNRDSLLRRIEMTVFRYPALFKKLGLFPHLTGPDSYLHFQKHQFESSEIGQFLASKGLLRKRSRSHVAPSLLGPLQGHPAVAMTVIEEFGLEGSNPA